MAAKPQAADALAARERDLTNREQMVALQAQHAANLQQQAADPASFMSARPDRTKDGIDFDGVAPTHLGLQFGRWEDVEGAADLDTDPEVALLHSLHQQAMEGFAGMIDTLRQVRDDDDPSLNADGRLKIATRILDPRMTALAERAENVLARVNEAITAEEGAISATLRVADPLDVAMFPEIRAAVKADKDPVGYASRAVREGDIATMQAIATAPPSLTGLNPLTYDRVRRALAEVKAPANVKRLKVLQGGSVAAMQALQALDKKANKFLNFRRGRELLEREAKRSAQAE